MAMKLLALTRGSTLPSARFRVRQHIPALRLAGVEVTEVPPRVDPNLLYFGLERTVRQRYLLPLAAAQLSLNVLSRIPDLASSSRYDATVIQRSVVPGFEPLVRLIRGPRFLDVDDAIWLEGLGGRWVPYLAGNVDVVIAGNSYLADYFSRYCRNVRVVPTAIDTIRYRVVRPKVERPFTVGWTGTSGNFSYLELIRHPLRQFLSGHPNSRFLAIADRDPNRVLGLPESQMVYRPWSVESEVTALAEMDVGVMPLEDGPWARGKCSYKMLQYMAAGLPVVVSPVGMNVEVLRLGNIGCGAASPDEWIAALSQLHADPGVGRALGDRGREIAEREFSVARISDDLARIFLGAGRGSS